MSIVPLQGTFLYQYIKNYVIGSSTG